MFFSQTYAKLISKHELISLVKKLLKQHTVDVNYGYLGNTVAVAFSNEVNLYCFSSSNVNLIMDSKNVGRGQIFSQ